jgi:tetratricopeptide (TPR) repeat protein
VREYERLDAQKEVDEGDWNSVGIDLMRSGDYDRAATAFEREARASDSGSGLYNMACARALGGKSKDALDLLERAIKAGPVDADHMAEDADLVTLHGEKRFEELLSLAEDLELDTGSFDWSWGHWRGKRQEKKRWSRSLEHFEQVTRDHPDVGRAWSNLGFAQLNADEAEKSVASFQKALDLSYAPGITMYNLACATAQAGDKETAFKWLDRSAEKGFKVENHAHWDDDLEPLWSDSRFEKYDKRDRWHDRKRRHRDDT